MKRSIAFFCFIVLASLTPAIRGQVVPAATGSKLTVNAGGFASAFQPDYAGNGIAQTSPDRLYGMGAYVDVRFTRWAQLEAEGRWLPYNQYLGINEDNYLIGPRVPFSVPHFSRAKVYGKFLVGIGSGSFLTGRSAIFSYGGGLDYRLTRKFTLRAFDFEYQQWRVTPTLYPYGASVGMSYKVF